jgi:hypothetical protein
LKRSCLAIPVTTLAWQPDIWGTDGVHVRFAPAATTMSATDTLQDLEQNVEFVK